MANDDWNSWLAGVAFGADGGDFPSQWHAIAAAVEAEIERAMRAYLTDLRALAPHLAEPNDMLGFLDYAPWRKVPDR